MSRSPTRNAVVALLGTPTRTEGSLNEPRLAEENGLRFNEKWCYNELRSDPSGLPMRVVYWMRYDLVGTCVRAGASEPWCADQTLAAALANADDRLAPLDGSRNPPVAPRAPYRPASEFDGPPDLGGRLAPTPAASPQGGTGR